MLKNLKRPQVLILVVVCAAILVVGAGQYFWVRAYDELEAKLEIYLKSLEIVKTEYLEKNLDNTKLVYGSIKGMLESLDDPYTRFMEPSAFKEMNVRLSGSYSGIGIYIGMKDKQLVVISPISGTPADKVGLKAMDKIMAIDSKSTKDMALDEAVSLIRGPSGSSVKLGILRGKWKEPKEYNVAREKITIKSVESKSLDKDLFYVKLNTFENNNAGSEMSKALDDAKRAKAKGLILDLRNNGGGLLRMAADIGSMFIKDGVIVYTVDRDDRKETISSTGQVEWDKPMVVLVNESSASASEILAGALQDNKVATIVGTHTFGKAYVQNVKQLDDGSAILLTIAKYYTPAGHDISKKGIIPDVLVELPKVSSEEALEGVTVPENQDDQLKMAIEVLKDKIGKGSQAKSTKIIHM